MLTIHVWPKRLKEFLLTHSLYKSPPILRSPCVIDTIHRPPAPFLALWATLSSSRVPHSLHSPNNQTYRHSHNQILIIQKVLHKVALLSVIPLIPPVVRKNNVPCSKVRFELADPILLLASVRPKTV